MNELARTHEHLRTELAALLRHRGPDEVAEVPVPACPAWTVHDTVAHLVGVGADILAGNLDGVATDPWTEAQVAARRGRSLTELLEEWDATDPQVEAMSEAFRDVQAQWCMDCLTHVADVRGALGEPLDAPTGEAMDAILRFTAGGYRLYGRKAGLPLARLLADGRPVLEVDDLGPATVDVPAFELLRGLTGRRSPDQLRAWRWTDVDDVEPWLAGFTWGPFTVRDTPLAL